MRLFYSGKYQNEREMKKISSSIIAKEMINKKGGKIAMKKIITVVMILALCVAFVLAGCSRGFAPLPTSAALNFNL